MVINFHPEFEVKCFINSNLPGTEMLESPSADSILHSSHSNKFGPEADIRVRQNLKIIIQGYTISVVKYRTSKAI